MQSGMIISSSLSGTVWYVLTQKIWAVAGYTFCTYNFYYICDSTFFFFLIVNGTLFFIQSALQIDLVNFRNPHSDVKGGG